MQRSQKYSSSSDSSASSTPPGGHSPPQHATNRPEARTELKPLFTHAPLSLSDREKNPSPPPRRRKRQGPTTPALTFDPLQSKIPSGRAEPPVQTPVSHQGHLTSTSSTNETQNWIPSEIDDQLPSGITAPPPLNIYKRPRTQSGSDESSQSPSYSASYSRYHYEPQSAGGSSAPPATPYASSDPHYGLDTDHHFNSAVMMAQCYGTTSADYPRVTPNGYGMTRDAGYPPQGNSWQYSNEFRDSY